ncbi:MAG: SpoIIE family protein phosphatase [Clostridia bacterium]|nr:SpoIIE family protein phosphatase [Clostridia bacterium]
MTSAEDFGLAGELIRSAERCGREAAERDEALSKKLRRVLSWNNFAASSVAAYGVRRRHIYVGDVDLAATRMGGDDIRRLFESVAGVPLSPPEFELNGTVLSMRLHSVNRFACRTGSYSCAASSVQRYYGGKRGCGADSGEERLDGDNGEHEEVRIEVTEDEPEAVSGDMIADFEADGRYYMILSDGMGSGKEAALTSGMATSLLERLIRSGAELETALKMLNQIIRSTERECSATVDIAEIDLATGEARFIKSGAAPSFVLRDGSIFRLQSKTVPLGILCALDAEMIKFDVQPGDTVVMISDGAARSYEEAPWLLDLMSTDEGVLSGDERLAAMTVVSEAAMRGSRDDITCGIMRIMKSA